MEEKKALKYLKEGDRVYMVKGEKGLFDVTFDRSYISGGECLLYLNFHGFAGVRPIKVRESDLSNPNAVGILKWSEEDFVSVGLFTDSDDAWKYKDSNFPMAKNVDELVAGDKVYVVYSNGTLIEAEYKGRHKKDKYCVLDLLYGNSGDRHLKTESRMLDFYCTLATYEGDDSEEPEMVNIYTDLDLARNYSKVQKEIMLKDEAVKKAKIKPKRIRDVYIGEKMWLIRKEGEQVNLAFFEVIRLSRNDNNNTIKVDFPHEYSLYLDNDDIEEECSKPHKVYINSKVVSTEGYVCSTDDSARQKHKELLQERINSLKDEAKKIKDQIQELDIESYKDDK